MGFERDAVLALKRIPRGKVSTYSEIARYIGSPRACRAVGNALNKNTESDKYPCYRVVRSDGRVGGYAKGAERKVRLLERDGIAVSGGRLDLRKHFQRLI